MTADNFKNVRKRSDKKFFAFQLSIDTDNEGQKKLLTAHTNVKATREEFIKELGKYLHEVFHGNDKGVFIINAAEFDTREEVKNKTVDWKETCNFARELCKFSKQQKKKLGGLKK